MKAHQKHLKRPNGFYWVWSDFGGWDVAHYCEKGWSPFGSVSMAYFPDDEMGRIGPAIVPPAPLENG